MIFKDAKAPVLGASLIVIYTLVVTVSDALTKYLAASYDAPQILVICSATVLAIILLSKGANGGRTSLKTSRPYAMAIRSVMTVAATILFFYAFALLPFADVFIYVACVPILVGVLSSPVLGEQISKMAWLALVIGCFGVFLLFPVYQLEQALGHVIAFCAVFCGTIAILMARYIAKAEDRPMALVFYPQLSILLTMASVAPFYWQPMPAQDVVFAMAGGLVLFAARYTLALAMQMLPAYAACSLINLQFVWMVCIGAVFFNEIPGVNTFFGATVVIGSGLFLVLDQHLRQQGRSIGFPMVWLASRKVSE